MRSSFGQEAELVMSEQFHERVLCESVHAFRFETLFYCSGIGGIDGRRLCICFVFWRDAGHESRGPCRLVGMAWASARSAGFQPDESIRHLLRCVEPQSLCFGMSSVGIDMGDSTCHSSESHEATELRLCGPMIQHYTTMAEQNGCRQRLVWHLSCQQRLALAVA